MADKRAPIAGDQNLERGILAVRDELTQLLIAQAVEEIGAGSSSGREEAWIHTAYRVGWTRCRTSARAEKNGPLEPVWPGLVVEAR